MKEKLIFVILIVALLLAVFAAGRASAQGERLGCYRYVMDEYATIQKEANAQTSIIAFVSPEDIVYICWRY